MTGSKEGCFNNGCAWIVFTAIFGITAAAVGRGWETPLGIVGTIIIYIVIGVFAIFCLVWAVLTSLAAAGGFMSAIADITGSERVAVIGGILFIIVLILFAIGGAMRSPSGNYDSDPDYDEHERAYWHQ